MFAEPIAYLARITDLPPGDLLILCAIAAFAGVVRGFSGFALSALVMATGTAILPPVALIPSLWFLEITASVLMVRGGIAESDRGVVTGLVVGALVGTPIGLSITTSVSPALSAMIALCVIIVLAATQLARIRFAFLSTRPGLLIAGIVSGVVTGLASVGGMVVALYVLARDAPARQMRASLVMYLFISSAGSAVFMVIYGLWDATTVSRGLVLSVPTGLGVAFGQRIFIPSLERFYRPLCLLLLIGLAATGLLHRLLG
ncbi:sulfite exporter TauE/SafE family protein [Pontivivens nitratireducens]|uniref:Probable membrane transporter protein n=1 Tax=Pontivivens nitratireducens TaxID=2758038 RepID=A0A6G7VP36_9RHOB|nr:sulfite exporter TauE/SafE family protein [Pontibrevibacter nitratireducens]QIK41618.1 sulfite exporter TauE/SafE family protein [Pontibrevibacter nitratireducens]